MTIKQKLKACYKVLFKNKPITTLTYGVRVVKCDDCEYNVKCEDCFYSDFAKITVKEIVADTVNKFVEKVKEEDGKDNHVFEDCASTLISEDYRNGRYEKTKQIYETLECVAREMAGVE